MKKNVSVGKSLGELMPMDVIAWIGTYLSYIGYAGRTMAKDKAHAQALRLATPTVDFSNLAATHEQHGEVLKFESSRGLYDKCFAREEMDGWEYASEGPVFSGIYQSELHEDGGWDGYNSPKVSLVYLTMAKATPPAGSSMPSKPVALLIHYQCDGYVKKLSLGVPVNGPRGAVYFGIADSHEKLVELASNMNIIGWGDKACSSFLQDCPIKQIEWPSLLNPQYYDRIDMEQATPEVSVNKLNNRPRRSI